MITLSGIIRENMTFGSGDTVSLSGNIQLAEGYTITLGAGSALLGNSNRIEVFGTLDISGTSDRLTEIDNLQILHKSTGSVSMSFAHYKGNNIALAYNSTDDTKISISNSVIEMLPWSEQTNWLYTLLDLPSLSVITGNIFSNINMWTYSNSTIKSNTFTGISTITVKANNGSNETNLEIVGNNFLSTSAEVLKLGPTYSSGHHNVTASGNYWATENASEIQGKIKDGNDDLNINGVVDVSNPASSYTSAPLQLGKYSVDLASMTLVAEATQVINLDQYAEFSNSSFVVDSYKAVMGTEPDALTTSSWTDKLTLGESSRTLYLRMVGELPDYKYALIHIDVAGSVGNDTFVSKFGDGITESFDGGAGLDTVSFDTATSFISKTASEFTVGGNTLTNIERLSFTDTNVALDIEGANSAGGIYRTYKAAFNRTPEKTGFGYWIDRADNGASAVQMAEEFVWSAEFQTLYGVTTSDNYLTGNNIEAVVDLFYRNVLGRAPDQGGLTYYTSTIEDQNKTGGLVLAEIADSAENRANVLSTIETGMSYNLWLG
jgi:hypothetical protein